MLRYGGNFQIFIKSGNEEIITIYAEASDTIDYVLTKIKDKKNFSTYQQRLLYQKIELEGGCTLADYNIQEGS